jgi:hypothetical protein
LNALRNNFQPYELGIYPKDKAARRGGPFIAEGFHAQCIRWMIQYPPPSRTTVPPMIAGTTKTGI